MKNTKPLRRIAITTIASVLILQPSYFASAASSAGGMAILQTEKQIAPGTTYREFKKSLGDVNITFREVEVDLRNPNVKVAPLYGAGSIGSKDKVSSMANRNGAVAAINSSFFRTDNEGATLGMLVKDGKLLTSPAKVPGWNTFAILKDGHALIDSFGFIGQVTAPSGKSFAIEGMNKTEYFPPGSQASNYSGTIHLFTSDWGPMSRGLLDGYEDILEMEVKDNIVTDIRENQGSKPIPQNGYVLFANGEGAKFLKDNFKLGDKVILNYQYTPTNVNLSQAIGANYLLVDKGNPVAQFPTDPDLNGRHSRSGLGISQDGTMLYLLAIDRTSEQNPGATLPELADILIGVGAYKAVNLDGGSSTSLVVQKPGDMQGTRVDDGSSGEEAPVADALAVFNTAPPGAPDHLEINGPKQVIVGSQTNYTFKGWDTTLHPIDPSKVNWSVPADMGQASGSSIVWSKVGNTQVSAEVGGKTITYPVSVIQKGYSFNDIAQHWARDNIEKMAQKGFAKGTGDGQFSPDRSLTRADFIVFLSRMLNWTPTDEDKATSLSEKVPDYAADVLKYAKRNGILVGDQAGKINPYKPISRVEAAAILARVLPDDGNQPSIEKLKTNYNDWTDIPEWGMSSVELLTEKQIFGGMDHRFYPKKEITRAEMVTVLLRAFIKE